MNRYEGKSIEEILEEVASKQQVNVSDLIYKVIEEKDGFLGLGKRIVAEVSSYKDIAEFIHEYLSTFFKNIEINVKVDVEFDGKVYRINLDAENNAVIIGRGGQTLQALTTVLRGAVNSRYKRRFIISLDINNYKADRYEKLKSLAYRVAKSVQSSKVAVKLDPMPSDERRIIHNYLSKMEHIVTISEGEGPERRLVISYKK